jgi:hypothetical protein
MIVSRWRSLIAAFLVIGLVASACGDEPTPNSEKYASQRVNFGETLRHWFRDVRTMQWDRACAAVSAGPGRSCISLLRQIANGSPAGIEGAVFTRPRGDGGGVLEAREYRLRFTATRSRHGRFIRLGYVQRKVGAE